MTVFDLISDILYTKKENCLQTVDQEADFQPYILNRWLSMHSKQTVPFANIIGKYFSVFESKKELYSLFVSTFPKVSYKKITYIKKHKEESKDDENIELVAKNLELSEREIREYISFNK